MRGPARRIVLVHQRERERTRPRRQAGRSRRQQGPPGPPSASRTSASKSAVAVLTRTLITQCGQPAGASRTLPPFGTGMVPSVGHAGAAQIGLICAKPVPSQIRPSAMPDRRCAAHLRSSALSGFLPVRPGSRAEGGAAIPGLDSQAAGLGPARWSRRDHADFVQWRQARGQRRLRPHPPAGHGLPGQPQ